MPNQLDRGYNKGSQTSSLVSSIQRAANKLSASAANAATSSVKNTINNSLDPFRQTYQPSGGISVNRPGLGFNQGEGRSGVSSSGGVVSPASSDDWYSTPQPMPTNSRTPNPEAFSSNDMAAAAATVPGGTAGTSATPYTGFGANLDELQMASDLTNPANILSRILAQSGFSMMQDSSLFRELLPFASDATMLSMLQPFATTAGAGLAPKDQSMDWIANFLRGAGTAGGNNMDWNQMAGVLAAQYQDLLAKSQQAVANTNASTDGTGTTVSEAPKMNTLQAFMGSLNRDDQGPEAVSSAFGNQRALLGAMARQSLHPMAAAAVVNQLAMLEQMYSLLSTKQRESVGGVPGYVYNALGIV